jgi:uncharacterized protein YuzE
MKFKYDYDSDADAISIDVGSLKSDITIELSEHILVDLSSEGKLVSIEIIEASSEISRLFNRAVSKDEIKQMLCEIKQEPENEYLIQFKSPGKNESANLLIPLYKSPVTYA